jgi:hypothetical protein
MTGLDRAICRETNVIDTTRGGRRRLIVKLEAGGRLLRIRPKGTRRWYDIDFASIYRMAVMAHAKSVLAQKKEARAAAKKAKASR